MTGCILPALATLPVRTASAVRIDYDLIGGREAETKVTDKECKPAIDRSSLLACGGDELETHYRHTLEGSANLPAPEVIAQEVADDLEAALEQFATIAEDLEERKRGR